jgi:AcrR family transcriptional regulator
MKATISRKERTAHRLRESIERIVNGVPSSPKLVAKLRAKGVLRLSIQAVADESGLSRETIYTHHPEIRREIETRLQKRPIVRVPASRLTESALRDEIALLKQRIADAMSENAALLKRITVADDRVRRVEDLRQSAGIASEATHSGRRGR